MKKNPTLANCQMSKVLLAILLCVLLLLSSCTKSVNNGARADELPSCWPQCNSGVGPMEFGVATATFTMGNYLGVSSTSYPSLKQVNSELSYLKDNHELFLHFYVSYKGGISSQFIASLKNYVKEGYQINLALRYVPPNASTGDPQGFANWVESEVKELSFVKVFQITNEVNASASSDSDGFYKGAQNALVGAMIAANKAKTKNQLIGFNWSYDPFVSQDLSFFENLKSLGGPSFVKSLNYMGIDLYPDTYSPLPNVNANFGKEVSSALELLRQRLMPALGLKKNCPIFIQEISWPSFDSKALANYTDSNFAEHFMNNLFGSEINDRSPERQKEFLKEAISSAKLFGVALFQWFSLTDADTALGDGWGLFYPNGSPKPAASVIRAAIDRGTNS
jgi:hypothetical protein